SFRHEAERRNLAFTTTFSPQLGRAITTDPTRLLQALKHLPAHAFKLTERGGVRVEVGVAAAGWNPKHPTLNAAPTVVAFSVSDTGIGIPPDKQRIVFEAFQQAAAGPAVKSPRTGPR